MFCIDLRGRQVTSFRNYIVHLAVRLIYNKGACKSKESVDLFEGLVYLKYIDVPQLCGRRVGIAMY